MTNTIHTQATACQQVAVPSPGVITCSSATPHFASGCELLKAFAVDGKITYFELARMGQAVGAGEITQSEYDYIVQIYSNESDPNPMTVNTLCPGCISVTGTGTLGVKSTPTGASVYLDNELQGITPLTISGVPVGVHDLTIELSGYELIIEQVKITNNDSIEVNRTLTATQLPPPISKGTSIAVMAVNAAALALGAGIVYTVLFAKKKQNIPKLT